jgi:dihydroorotase
MMRTCRERAWLIRGGRIIDPAARRDEPAELAIAEGLITDAVPPDARVFDASGCIVCPGLWDMHVHLREPGAVHKETIESGCRAAAAGGFTHVACMPNTRPAIDDPNIVQYIRRRAEQVGLCTVMPVAAITMARAGRELTDFAALRGAGAVAFTDDGDGVEDDRVMEQAFVRAGQLGAILVQHCEYRALSRGGVLHAGSVAERLGLPGLDPASEERMVERDIALCRKTGGRYHVAHISTARAVETVRRAKAEGVPVTAEVTPHHLLLTHEACAGADTNTKMHPPLRTAEDVSACRAALADGTIDCVATDHAPHARHEKDLGFLRAPPGVVGLETAIPLVAKAMIDSGCCDWPDIVRWLTTEPARVLGRDSPTLQPGTAADVTIIDPSLSWTIDPERFQSLSRNTPFAGWTVKGWAVATIRGSRLTLSDESGAARLSGG